ncbi:phage integrase Arm DNA-binding domain-containing protein [Amphritea sp. HPY]|uniref:phage integrase Arm DNA-binding domain-containing protein n=1 Tax=Amphritea sp. HPY TaxID=3421652 RepID=UPI003D7C47F9
MNRPRKPGNRDLPYNLYATRKGKAVYFSYKHPKTGDRTSMGSDRIQAILAANQLNTMLITEVSLVDRVLGRANTFDSWLDKYTELRSTEGLAKKTQDQLTYDIGLMREKLGPFPIIDITVFHCSDFLDTWVSEGKRRMAKRMRSQLVKCFEFAMGHGLVDSNPAQKTLQVSVQVTRKRLTKDQFDAILELAPPHIQNAMLLGLITLQRREDIAAMKFSKIKDGFLHVVQQKTEKSKKRKREDSTNNAAHLRIAVTDQLKPIIKQCRQSGILSKYLIHHIQSRRSAGATHKEVKAGMPLQPDNITRGFASARNRTGLFDSMPAKERPTFHEIRSLGAHLYQEQGIDPQALLGHTDAKMTAHYLDGHGIEWTVVNADLAI